MKTKKMMAFTLGIAALALVCIFGSCSKDSPKPGGTHKLQFKAVSSEGSDLNIAVYGFDTDIKTVTGLSGTTWQSEEMTTTAGAVSANVNVSAAGANASSTLRVEIWVDGKKVKEGTSTGPALAAVASYRF